MKTMTWAKVNVYVTQAIFFLISLSSVSSSRQPGALRAPLPRGLAHIEWGAASSLAVEIHLDLDCVLSTVYCPSSNRPR